MRVLAPLVIVCVAAGVASSIAGATIDVVGTIGAVLRDVTRSVVGPAIVGPTLGRAAPVLRAVVPS